MRAKACNPAAIQDYLSETISSEQETLLMEHLDECQVCCQKLEATAAAGEVWDSASLHLVDQDFDPVQLSGLLDVRALDSDGQSEQVQAAEIQNVLTILGPTDDPQMLGRLGPYEISGVVGAGGMGIVLKGHDLSLERTVAIKVLAPHLASSGPARSRFAREARAAAAVLHPNVMAIHGVNNKGPLPYLVMPYLRGASLQKRIDEQGPLATVEIVRVAAQIAAGLAAAHAQGLVHRDIKPANMMLADGIEQVAITDFGLARAVDDATMTRSGIIAGTPQYMSPEQARGETIDARSDLFSLGSLVYTMATGRPPFRAESAFGVLRRITDKTPRDIREINPNMPTWLCRLVELLHEKDPKQRIQSAQEVEKLLNRCLAHLEQPSVNRLPTELATTSEAEPTRIGKLWLASSLALICLAPICLFLALSMQGVFSDNGADTTLDGTSAEQKQTRDPSFATEETKPIITPAPTLKQMLQEQERDWQELQELTNKLDELERTIKSDDSEENPND
ncbi:MAG: serine/threonine-protein kinase [Planctomycetota bacterium]